MPPSDSPTAAETIVHYCGRTDPPDLRFLHYNDVYHIESGSAEPIGGVARFKTLCEHYRSGEPKLLALFSGDAFNPSLESSVTKGSHMVPVLNKIGTSVACLGNHDLDFGVAQFEYLAKQCTFPWLVANVLDPGLGADVPLANAKKYVILTSTNGIKVGVLGLVEREWLDTINSLPPNLVYKSASATAKELVPRLRQEGADIVIAITHAREPNDVKCAENTPEGLLDMILGGHDHIYSHQVINGAHLLRSGTDFKQLSYIKAWKRQDGSSRWDFDIIRRDLVREIPEDPEMSAMVEAISSGLRSKLEKPVGYTATPLDARFTTVRLGESNLGNFVCDLMRLNYQADCAIMAAGTIRGDQVYPPGIIRLKDIMDCFPFEDPVVVLRISGKAVLEALENGVSTYPALEGRFPQVSNIRFSFDPKAPPKSRIRHIEIGGEPLGLNHRYTCATRDYMARGKGEKTYHSSYKVLTHALDGFDSLKYPELGGAAETIISEETGMLISILLRQYFMSLKVIGRWKNSSYHMDKHWDNVQDSLHESHPVREAAMPFTSPATLQVESRSLFPTTPPNQIGKSLHGLIHHRRNTIVEGHVIDSDSEHENEHDRDGLKHVLCRTTALEREAEDRKARDQAIMRKVLRKWWRVSGLPGHPGIGHEEEGEFNVGWTRGIAPKLEGRIKIVAEE